CQQGYSHPPTF
nr:immunoglobulin light chain junction region [Macaca mulatta]MOV34387.1 immunoglobulin light chain junction region [Macaca mulatta]MOV34527.1 immunoglobulin light chain junction region [Macaca mulatta]MOV35194.1 immunoglobulin light chain junction region [Macaca mulatta]